MHKKYSSQGLVVITLNTDAANDNEVRASVRGFLNKMQAATTTNLLLDEPQKFIETKLRYESLPCYYIFDPQGRWTQFKSVDGKEIDYDAMDRLIVKLLQEKK